MSEVGESEAFVAVKPVAILTVRACDDDDQDPTDSAIILKANKSGKKEDEDKDGNWESAEIIKDILKVQNGDYIPAAYLVPSPTLHTGFANSGEWGLGGSQIRFLKFILMCAQY